MPNAPASLPGGSLMADLAGTVLDQAEREFLRHPSVGAIILFSRNYESPQQVSALIRDIRAQRSPPLPVAVDQEGGRVQRFRDGFSGLPPLFALGRLHQEEPDRAITMSRAAGRLMALELRQVGVDFSFAPVLDLADRHSRVIGDRGFHGEARVITVLARAYIEGMASAGMRATGKHFPGHGGVVEDSHHETPLDHRSLDQLWERDLLPYRELHGMLGGIMTAHVRFPAVDEHVPTYSRRWIAEVLRQDIGFRGVVFSDDLTMAGAADIGPPEARARKALAAGCDMVLVCNDAPAAAAVADGLLTCSPGRNIARSMAASEYPPDSGETGALRRQLEPLERFA
jgi:beta-N-acetylhexosaminidase